MIGLSVAIRLLFLALKPAAAISGDLRAWGAVIAVLGAGQNPYATGGAWGEPILRWLPFWLPILAAIRAVGAALGLSLTASVQTFLIAAECGVIASTAALLREFGVRKVRGLLLVGIACNPICVLLTVQHGNFDVLVGWSVVLLLLFLAKWERERRSLHWLLACLSLGVGIGLKTVPLVLSPLLLTGVPKLPRSKLAQGAQLAFGLPLLGLGVVYALAPGPVAKYVIGYRSLGGWFGLTGLLHFLGRDDLLPLFARLFALAMAAAMALAGWQVLRGRLAGPVARTLAALLLLAAIPLLGPGYGPQYIWWFWPLVLVAFATGSPLLRRLLAGFAAVAAVTYVAEYALIEAQGAFWLHRFGSATDSLLAVLLRTHKVKTLLRLPLFLAYGAMLGGVWREIRSRGYAGSSGFSDSSRPSFSRRFSRTSSRRFARAASSPASPGK